MPRITVLPLLFVFCLSCRYTARSATWDRLGPNGGCVTAISVAPTNPAVIYAGGAFVFRSSDGGAHWARTTDVFPAYGPESAPPLVKSLLVCPRDANRAVVASAQGLFLTTDGGATWKRAAGITADVSSIAFSLDGRRLYASVGEVMYRSMNSGDTWDSLAVPNTIAMCGDPKVASAFLGIRSKADAGGRTLFRTDDGTGWYPVSSLNVPSINCIVANSATDLIYVSSADSAAGGVWKITREGASACIAAAPTAGLGSTRAAPTCLLAIPASGYPAVRRTWDDGNNWEPLQTGSAGKAPLCVAVGAGLTPIAGTARGGVMICDVDGVWHTSNAGLGMSSLTGVAESADGLHVLMAAAGDGLYRSTNSGDTWALSHPSTLRSIMATSPAKPGRVLHTGPDGLEKSDDNGQTWQHFMYGLPAGSDVARVVAHPALQNMLFAVRSDGAIFQNTTSNPNWIQRLPAFTSVPATPPDLVIAPSQPLTMYTIREDGCYRSTDGGLHWALRSASNNPAARLAVRPDNENTVYQAATTGTTITLARSIDGAATWTTIRTETGAANSGFAATFLATDGRQPNRILLGTNRGLRISDDAGVTWRTEGIGSAATFATAWAPFGTGGDFLATAGAGVLRTRPPLRGATTAADALRIIALALSGKTPTLEQMDACDLNDDGRITMGDADQALRSAVGP